MKYMYSLNTILFKIGVTDKKVTLIFSTDDFYWHAQ